ncbi:MAG: hypothetical protein JW847_02985 [Candidatus Omnitrophica bacterium]|nr:hypothetical protein [Candidatus Omnitrophota bacterium]
MIIPEALKEYDYRTNLIVDKNNPILIQKAWRDHFSGDRYWKNVKKGGKAYLGVSNSEDAMTWNVFRSLQKEGKRGFQIIADVFGLSRVEKILFWGCDVETEGEEQQLLNILIRTTDGQLTGTMTEPDMVFIAAKEVVFVECKLNQSGGQSPWKAQNSSDNRESGAKKRMQVYKNIKHVEYDKIITSEKLRFPNLAKIGGWQDIYQIIRQYIYASLLGDILGKKPTVIPLIHGDHRNLLEPIYLTAKNNSALGSGVLRDMVTWQDIKQKISQADLECSPNLVKKMSEALRASKMIKEILSEEE